MEQPKIPTAQIVFGDIVYWLCIISAIICMVGPVISIFSVDNNVMNPHFLFSVIWEGKEAAVVWEEVGGGFPGGHFWLNNLTKGDGFTQFGLVIGCACAFPALLGASIVYLSRKPRLYIWAILSLWVAAIITFSMIGVVDA